MAHTQTWNASFEAIPANGVDASEGALRIRNLKRNIRERLEIDHIMDETNADGRHAQITFDAPRASPTNEVNVGFLYTKDVSAKAELHWMDEDGNELQLTSGGALKGGSYPFVTNDSFLARVATVASGFSTVSVTNKAVRINSSATTATSDGGSNGFTTSFNSAFSSSSTGSHTHGNGTLSVTVPDSGNDAPSAGGAYNIPAIGSVSVTGSMSANSDHSHTVSLNVQYRDFREIKKS